MQPSVHLNQKDIARLHKAIERLMLVGEALLGTNGHKAEEAPKKRRRRRRTSSDAPTPVVPRKRRSQESADPSSSA